MTQEKNDMLVKAMLDNDQLLADISRANTADDLHTIFQQAGLDVSMEESEELMAAARNNGELSEQDLEKVSGGFLGITAAYLITCAIVGAASGAAIGLGALAVKKSWKELQS